jgi:hypothetical protein
MECFGEAGNIKKVISKILFHMQWEGIWTYLLPDSRFSTVI